MPDEPDQPSKPSRSRPRLNDLAGETLEDELWNLDDDDSQPADVEVQPRNPKARPAPRAVSQPEEVEDKPGERAEAPAGEPPAEQPEKHEALAAKKPKPSRPLHASEDELDLPEEEADDTISAKPTEPETAPETGPDVEEFEKKRPAAAAATPPVAGANSQKIEKIGLISLAVVVVGIAIWAIAGLFSSVSTTELGEDFPDLPAEGKYATIDEVDTYWRKPVREGEDADAATAGVLYIPIVSVTLDEGGSGVLRILFRDENGEFVGDAISRRFANGSFTESGSETADFAATDGFREISEFNGYRVGTERWTAEIYEGPSADASGSEFKQLVTTPLFPKTR